MLPLPLSHHRLQTHSFIRIHMLSFFFWCFSHSLCLRLSHYCHTSLLIIWCFSLSLWVYNSNFLSIQSVLVLVSPSYNLSFLSIFPLLSLLLSPWLSVFAVFSNYVLKMHRSFYWYCWAERRGEKGCIYKSRQSKWLFSFSFFFFSFKNSLAAIFHS